MNADGELLLCYQRLMALSKNMLALAQQGLWDDLIHSEASYLKAVERIAGERDISALPPALVAQLQPILKHVLANENQLRGLLQRRMEELHTLVGHTSRQQDVNKAYSHLAGNILFPQKS